MLLRQGRGDCEGGALGHRAHLTRRLMPGPGGGDGIARELRSPAVRRLIAGLAAATGKLDGDDERVLPGG